MKPLFGVGIAAIALIVVFLWFTDRLGNVWNDIKGGSNGSQPNGLKSDPGQSAPGSAGGWGTVQAAPQVLASALQIPTFVTPPAPISPYAAGYANTFAAAHAAAATGGTAYEQRAMA